MAAPQSVRNLVARFERNRAAYESPHYNETQVRREFVDPFFKALGWDVDNEAGYAEPYKDVFHEDSLKIAGATKAPDYSFRIGGTRKFFVETKKPSVNLKKDPAPAYQLRRYAWSAKLPLGVLTDFAEFVVYDCRPEPLPTDKSSMARTMYVTYDEYEQRWDEIAGVFSREAVLQGSFDDYSESTKRKRGTAEVDKAFLLEIEEWRKVLAANVALRNPQLTQADLNWVVQQTIDRIVFLRICEDRGIQDYGSLRSAAEGREVYGELVQLFLRADEKYNSGLFHFHRESNRNEPPDELSQGLSIDDKPLKGIIRRLYYPDSPYEFSVLPADILGHVYEQFLGKVIRLTSGHRAVVEEKPEVRRGGGVYYTPTYIVNFIVGDTIGKLVEGRKPSQISSLRVVDPACGSGSFLIAAYQFLLDWHLNFYLTDDPKKHARARTPRLYESQGGAWRLTTVERKRILLNNIYGVDVDLQAVEVTKLSLLLKVLEGETQDSLNRQLELFHERALPDLAENIKWGNSLVGPDYHERGQQEFLGEAAQRVNAFDWRLEFADVLAKGGFDAVIGNPPYVYRNATEEELRPYYRERYRVAEGNYELYKFFLERSLDLLKTGGRLGMIVSASFLVQPSFKRLRELLATNSTIHSLAPLGPKAFVDATVDTTIVVMENKQPTPGHRVEIRAPSPPTALPVTGSYSALQERFQRNEGSTFDYRLSDEGAELVARLVREFPKIETAYEFGVGINTGFIREELVADSRLDKRFHPMVPGNGISRYGPVVTRGWIMYDRDYVRSRGRQGRSLPEERFLSSEKILVVRTRNLSLKRRVIATVDTAGGYNLNRLSNIIAREHNSLSGLLGILNSTLFNWLYATRYYDYEIKPVYLRNSPLADANDPELVSTVDQMRLAMPRFMAATTTREKTFLERQVRMLDQRIDDRVFALYGLKSGEVELVTSDPALQGTDNAPVSGLSE